MIWLCLALLPASFLISFPLTALLIRLGHRLETFDSAGVAGQVKERRRVPNTGGVGLFWAIVLPIAAGLAAAWFGNEAILPEAARPHLAGLREQTPMAVILLASLTLLHIMGLVDDRRPMGPWLKMAVMAAPALAVPILTDTRLLEFLDKHVGGPWLSIGVTALWFLAVTNAMNFMDNMDGLSAGVAAVAGACFLAATLVNGQWFVAACLALLLGSCLGFLVFNAPRWGGGGARIFMGDGGSLVLGFTLAFLTTRTTYYVGPDTVTPSPPHPITPSSWYGVFMPLVVLAVPLYDFCSVLLIRLSQGQSPLVGDQQHLSHRLVKLGLGRAGAVAVIWGLTAVTGISGIALASLQPWQAVLVGVQTGVILIVIALFEYARARSAQSEA